jgi:hypothetical protein
MPIFLPDWSPDTIEEIEKILTKNYIVYEWGIGNSTLWLAQRAGQVISMEHNPVWYDKIKAEAKALGLFNIDFNLYPLEDDRYFTHIRNTGDLDFVIVDGRERVRCFKEAIKRCPFIMLDDSERERYKEVFDMGLMFLYTIPNSQGQKATIFQGKVEK